MQPRSARTLGTLARKCLSTSSRLPGLAVMTAMTWIIWFALPEGLARAELDRLSYRPVDHAARRGNDSPGAAPGGGGDLRRAGGRGLAGRDRGLPRRARKGGAPHPGPGAEAHRPAADAARRERRRRRARGGRHAGRGGALP